MSKEDADCIDGLRNEIVILKHMLQKYGLINERLSKETIQLRGMGKAVLDELRPALRKYADLQNVPFGDPEITMIPWGEVKAAVNKICSQVDRPTEHFATPSNEAWSKQDFSYKPKATHEKS